MIIKTLVFVLLSITAIQAYAENDSFDFGDIGQGQHCSMDDLLHAQGKSACLLRLNTTRESVEEMGARYVDFYTKLQSQKLDANFMKQLEENHIKFANGLAELLKEFRTDIKIIKATLNSAKRKHLCQKYYESLEKKQAYLNGLALGIRTQLMNADIPGVPSDTWWTKTRDAVGATWNKLERPLITAILIGMFCELGWKIGKRFYTLAKRRWIWAKGKWNAARATGENEPLTGETAATEEGELLSTETAAAQQDIQAFSNTINELSANGELGGADTSQLMGKLADVVEPNAELAGAAEEAAASEATSVMNAYEATQAAVEAAGSSDGPAFLLAARAAQVARVTSSAEALEAVQASELAQVATIVEASEGLGEATIEAAVEGAGEAVAEGVGEVVVGGVGEAVVGETAVEGALAAIGGAVEGGAVVTAGAFAWPVVAVVTSATVVIGGVTYYIWPEDSKKMFNKVSTSIKHLFHYL